MDSDVREHSPSEHSDARRADAERQPTEPRPREQKQREPGDGAAADASRDGDERSQNKPDNKHDPWAGPPRPAWRRNLAFIVFGVLVIAAAVGGTLDWLNSRHYESTDDAFIDGYISQIAPQVSGKVIRLAVADNQQVAAGQLLVQIDPRDYQQRLEQAQAQLGNAAAQAEQARAQLGVQQASLGQAEANVTVSEAENLQAQQDFARYHAIDPRAITRQQLDTATAQANSSQARVEASRQAAAAARAQVEAAKAQVAAADAAVKEARANVDYAALQLSYTDVNAPQAGRVTKRTVDLGNYVSPGQAMLAVVPENVWVTANFKETQLADMRPGQAVDIWVDAYPGVKFHGRVDSFQRGTGSVFSSLPAENATGNYVKIVQRLPVKLIFDDPRVRNYELAPGMSVSREWRYAEWRQIPPSRARRPGRTVRG